MVSFVFKCRIWEEASALCYFRAMCLMLFVHVRRGCNILQCLQIQELGFRKEIEKGTEITPGKK